MTTILGRKEELKILARLHKSQKAEFLAIYGRRRIGKTYLIHEYFKDKGIYFDFTGTKGASKEQQLRNFADKFASTFRLGNSISPLPDWQEAFFLLRKELETLSPNQKFILFFDELPWIASPKSGMLSALEYFWNSYLSKKKNVLLIVCGSAASWMIKKIAHNKGGFHNRLTQQIRLLPFTLNETEQFLQAQGVDLERKRIVEIYAAIGGVASYLSHVQRGLSSAQVIQKICFAPQAPLISEFPRLYESLFDDAKKHMAIVEALAKKRSGMTLEDLLHATDLPSGGGTKDVLEELEESGFIMYVHEFGKKKKEGRYRLIDEYSLFYFTWIKPAFPSASANLSQDYWMKKQGSPTYASWAGYTFEGICFKHVENLIKAMELSVVATSFSGWNYRPTEKTEKGAQIDLVVDRSDKCVTLIEIKFHEGEFVIDKQYASELAHKKQCFKQATKTRKHVFLTLLTAFGAKENAHYLSVIDSQLTLESLFHLT